jgi:hypothetical protein
MSPATIQLLSDALKILGPAIIAALATYKGAQLYLKAKVSELASAGELRARENLFTYYKDRLEYLWAAAKDAGVGIGKLYAIIGTQGDEAEKAEPAALNELRGFVSVLSTLLMQEVGITRAELQQAQLEDSPQFRRLQELAAQPDHQEQPKTTKALLDRLAAIVETYSFLCHCTQVVLESRMKELWDPYLSRRSK